jgi:TolB protein
LLAPETPIPAIWRTFTSADYAVTLRYPPGWVRDPRYTLPDQERLTGSDGFFQVSASSAESIDAAADHEAHQMQQPYGSRPTITPLRVAGQDARLILPSTDQPRDMSGQSAIIVRSPQPIRLAGASYPYLVLWVDQAHVRAVVSTLRFISANQAGVLAGPPRFD